MLNDFNLPMSGVGRFDHGIIGRGGQEHGRLWRGGIADAVKVENVFLYVGRFVDSIRNVIVEISIEIVKVLVITSRRRLCIFGVEIYNVTIGQFNIFNQPIVVAYGD